MNLISSTCRRVLIFSFALTGLSLGLAPSQAANEDALKKTFSVKPGGQLVIDADRGSITVKTTTDNLVEIEVERRVRSWTGEKADQVLKDHEVSFSQDGDRVNVKARFAGADRRWWNSAANQLQVKYLVQVPGQFNLDLKTAGGSVTVPDITGEVKSQTAGGSLTFGKIEGVIRGKTAGGSINLAGCSGEARLNTAGGGIKVGQAGGDLEAETSGGSIHIESAVAKVKAHTAGGGINLSGQPSQVDARTSGGSISASLGGRLTEDSLLATSAGSITVRLPGTAALEIDAETSAGSVQTDLPVTVQGKHRSSQLHGTINNGGPKLTLRTSAGSIRLRKLHAAPAMTPEKE